MGGVQQMTNQEINVKIAESYGWAHNGHGAWHLNGQVRALEYQDLGEHGSIDALPDYCNDLNEMHEVVKTLSDEEWTVYFMLFPNEVRNAVEATAYQRAVAYLKAKGLWKD